MFCDMLTRLDNGYQAYWQEHNVAPNALLLGVRELEDLRWCIAARTVPIGQWPVTSARLLQVMGCNLIVTEADGMRFARVGVRMQGADRPAKAGEIGEI